jgi:hypothetical protein
MRKHSPLVNTHRRMLFLRDAMETSACEEILPTNQTPKRANVEEMKYR